MQAKSVNQKRGPTTGNAGTASKRDDFMAAKSSTGSERSKIANMITDAVSARGRGMQGYRDQAVEGLHDKTNVGRKGSNKGNKA
jgi:hypothetical protein